MKNICINILLAAALLEKTKSLVLERLEKHIHSDNIFLFLEEYLNIMSYLIFLILSETMLSGLIDFRALVQTAVLIIASIAGVLLLTER